MEPLHLHVFPMLEPGERTLAVRPYVRAICSISPPTYRWFFLLPPLFDIGLYVTDRRIMVMPLVLRLLNQPFSQWYPGADQSEILVETRIGRSRFLGPYLEAISENSGRFWYRSPRACMRYYMASPEAVRDVLPVPEGGCEKAL